MKTPNLFAAATLFVLLSPGLSGQQSFATAEGSNTISLDLSSFPVGLYFIQLDKDEEHFSGRLIHAGN